MLRFASAFCAAWLLAAAPATAASLRFEGSFPTGALVPPFLGHAFDPDGIAHDPVTGNLFLVDSFEPRVVVVTPGGAFVSTFVPDPPLPQLIGPEGIDVVSEGGVQLSDAVVTSLLRFDASGTFLDGFFIGTAAPSPTAVAEDPTTGGWFVSDDSPTGGSIRRLDAAGTLLVSIPTGLFGTHEPEGVDYDPVTGDVFFVSDDTAEMYRITTAGALVEQWDLAALTGFEDPEGIAIDAETRTIWVAFDNDARVGRFTLPEPGQAGGAAAAAALALLAARRRPAQSLEP